MEAVDILNRDLEALTKDFECLYGRIVSESGEVYEDYAIKTGNIWFVNCNSSNQSNNGKSWSTAYKNINSALVAAKPGDCIWVARGIYGQSIIMKDGVEIYGGFVGNEEDITKRDWQKNITRLENRSAPNFTIIHSNNAKYRLDGFFISTGQNTLHSVKNENHTTAIIANCNIQSTGISIFSSNSTLIISNSQISSKDNFSIDNKHSNIHVINSSLESRAWFSNFCGVSSIPIILHGTNIFKNNIIPNDKNLSIRQATPNELQNMHKLIAQKKISFKTTNARDTKGVMLFLSKNGFIPKELSQKPLFKELYKLEEYLQNNKLSIDESKNGTIEILGEKLILNGGKNEKINKESDKMDKEIEPILNADYIRANIEPLEKTILTDVNRGSWELFEGDNKIEGCYPRDPKKDIVKNGLVGIDFGTSSTVAVFFKNNQVMPIKIGSGALNKGFNPKDYENPSVMEFRDIGIFLQDYKSQKGRPKTKWEDLTISHTAKNRLLDESESQDYYTFFGELKQWAGDREQKVTLKDKQNKTMELPIFLNLKDDEFNPIEIYAYYLGLYINNQRNGIYLKYLLSFPVLFEKSIKDKILKSFEAGIRKSLPKSLYSDKLELKEGASEPAAFALSALTEYQKEHDLEPTEDSSIYYGVFDFGGGTTDFDFGEYRYPTVDEEECGHQYVLEHFGNGGDRYLGGENILELLAFETFKDNMEKLREAKITFTKPADRNLFLGHEGLIEDSQEARINTRLLKEELRELWERREGYESKFNKGKINLKLFDKLGNKKTNFELAVNQEKLDEIIQDRIEEGVKGFFISLRNAFEDRDDRKIINIFLSGNSSKSVVLKEIFAQYIKENESGRKFKLFEPLKGSEDIDVIRPNTKTGVAFGLILGRESGEIKVINNNLTDDDKKETKFRYSVGLNRRGNLDIKIDKTTPYKEWKRLNRATRDFEIYYTELSVGEDFDITKAKTEIIAIEDKDEDSFVYIRAIAPSKIEYTLSSFDLIDEDGEISFIVELH